MAASSLIHQRCYHHGLREAVARCPECRRFFCRECIAEHDERMICAECLTKKRARPSASRSAWSGVPIVAVWILGLGLGFLFFYGVGRFLLTVPPAYHDGTIWRKAWKELGAK